MSLLDNALQENPTLAPPRGSMGAATSVNPWFHPKFKVLFLPKRYKVFRGGRGGMKTWAIARALVLLGAQKPLRILCAREFQKSIKESVHQVLEGQIEKLGLGKFYEVQRDSIKGRVGTSAEGTEFFFIGLHLNTSNVKSYEDVDICWVEEADAVTDSSWNDLTPTIRKPTGGPFGVGAEIWISFNPKLETDATYERFVLNPPTDSVVVETSYLDNPYLSDGIKQEIEDLKRKNYDQYLHVWRGFCRQTLEGAVYADELRDATEQKRITVVPYDKSARVNCYFDLGRSDHTSIWFIQQLGFQYRVIDFYESRLKHIDHYIEKLQTLHYLYDTIWLPHDAKAKQLGSKMTIEEQMREKFPNSVRIVPKVSIKDKINAARTVFSLCYFDQARCSVGLQHLRHYAYETESDSTGRITKMSEKPSHEGGHSDAASAFEYFGVACKMGGRSAKDKVREALKGILQRGNEAYVIPSNDSQGWMK